VNNDREGDYIYEVWRRGGNPDLIDRDEIPEDFDWVWNEPLYEQINNGGKNDDYNRILSRIGIEEG
jgi:hypothetical protein